MSVIRQDPTTKEWVIIATERAQRPHDFRRVRPAGKLTAYDPGCPFCPGNEGATPREVLCLGRTESRPWAVRVILNKFAALTRQGTLHRREPAPLFREMDGLGFHEVIIETPVHNRFIPLMEDAEVETILSAYQRRYRTLRDDAVVKYIVLFKNHGEAAGTSLEHPHSQLVATPVPPALLRRKYEVATQYYDDTGRCLYCDLVQAELEEHQRVILETERFVVFHSYASRAPFETWIAPRAHQPSFGLATADELAELASVLKRALRGLYEALDDPDFNYIVHSAPVEDDHKAFHLWHLQILPRLTTIAGFELGSGIFISTVVPEESAAFMRDHLVTIGEAPGAGTTDRPGARDRAGSGRPGSA